MRILFGLFLIFTVLCYSQDSTKIMEKGELEHETEEIIINATRSTRTIENEPTRVEFIGAEELDEKISMDPSGISMILNESTGIQVQQTSPFSADNTFRIHGLPGRYTQLLKDGFPLYSGLSSSLSLLQIPPLDLKQIEIIKGSASTLYGGGAIAGLINLITKQPTEKGETSFLLNGTTASGIDLSIFSAKRNDKIGYTVLASNSRQIAYDANDDLLADIPEFQRYVFNPRLFFYTSENTNLILGGSYIYEDRWGGNVSSIEKRSLDDQKLIQRNLTRRANTESAFNYLTASGVISIKNSFNYFTRNTTSRSVDYGEEFSSYSEATYSIIKNTHQWIAGLTLQTENSLIKRESIHFYNQNSYSTAGLFIQSNIDINEHLLIELGTRLDYNMDYKFFFLPRLSLLYRWTDKFTTRLSSGLGYILPRLSDTHDQDIGNYYLDKSIVDPERAAGFNFDFNYNTIISEDVTFSLNQLFFYTRINEVFRVYPLTNMNDYTFFNILSDGHYLSRGIETNMKLSYKNIKLYTGYSYNYVSSSDLIYSGELSLTPRNRIGLVLFYEVEGDFKIGLESYYTGTQQYFGVPIKDFWISGIMAEKKFGNVSLFINFENLFDYRQPPLDRYLDDPESVFRQPSWAPREGRIINGGVKFKF